MAGIREMYENAKQKFTNREPSPYDAGDEEESSEEEQPLEFENAQVEPAEVVEEAPVAEGEAPRSRRHSQGLDSLFASTAEKPERVMAEAVEVLEEEEETVGQVFDASSLPSISQEIPTVDFDGRTQSRISVGNAREMNPQELNASQTSSMNAVEVENAVAAGESSKRARQVVVIDPDNMEEAQIVTDSLKRGDCVILDLRRTDPTLASRFLDFSFGATSALGGGVDVIENRVYAITVGRAITEIELDHVKADSLL